METNSSNSENNSDTTNWVFDSNTWMSYKLWCNMAIMDVETRCWF